MTVRRKLDTILGKHRNFSAVELDGDVMTGDLTFSGDGSGLYFGSMYSNATIAVTIGDSNPTEIGDTWTAGLFNGVAFGASHYLNVGANGAGMYLVNWSLAIAQNSPGAAIQTEQGIMIDGSAINPGRTHRTIANSTDTGASAGTAIIDLSANEQVSLFVLNETNTTNLDVQHGNLTIVQIGGT
jgi:hypothetical protein